MNVVLASIVFPHPRRGVWPGIERHVSELARALVREGAAVTVLTTYWNGGEERDRWEGVEILRVPDAGRRWGRAGHLFNMHVWSFGRSLLDHRGLLRAADAIHAFVGLSSHRELAALGVPLFASFPHREAPARLSSVLTTLGDFYTERRYFRRAAGVFAGSEASRRVLIEEYGLDGSRVHVVPLGVDGGVFAPPAAPRPRDPATERPEGMRLLYVGPLVRRKGIHTVVEALPLLERASIPCRLDLVGRGPEEQPLRDLAARLGVSGRVAFAGYVAEPELIRWYQQADAFVFPSTREGFGLVLVEAMACGLPAVVSDVPPMPEVVGEAGLLAPPGDPAALARCIGRLARESDLRERLSREGRRRVEERYLWPRVARQTLEHYARARVPRAGAA